MNTMNSKTPAYIILRKTKFLCSWFHFEWRKNIYLALTMSTHFGKTGTRLEHHEAP